MQVAREDLERRSRAKDDLKQALQSHLDSTAARDISVRQLAEIWGAYAVSMYHSLAASYENLSSTGLTFWRERGSGRWADDI